MQMTGIPAFQTSPETNPDKKVLLTWTVSAVIMMLHVKFVGGLGSLSTGVPERIADPTLPYFTVPFFDDRIGPG